jgi:hypothetical protein
VLQLQRDPAQSGRKWCSGVSEFGVVKPQLMLSIRRGLKRLRVGDTIASRAARASVERSRPADGAWHEMLRRLDREDAERRLEAMEQALNSSAEH